MFGLSTFWLFLFFCVACSTVCRVMAHRVKERDAEGTGATDVEMIQDIHRGLQRMESRVESLETIIMDNAKSQYANTDNDY